MPIISGQFNVNTIEDGISYVVELDKQSLSIASDATTGSFSLTGNFYEMEGSTKRDLYCAFVLWKRNTSGTYTNIMSASNVKGFSSGSFTLARDIEAVVITLQRTLTANPQTYFYKVEIPVVKNGNNGQQGEQGPRGKMSRNLWFAGMWNDSSVSGQSFTVTDYSAPYVQLGWKDSAQTIPDCKVFVGDNNTYNFPSTQSGYQNTTNWADMTSDFEYLIVKAILAKYAQLGSIIFNGDFAFSQYGLSANGAQVTGNANWNRLDYNNPYGLQYLVRGNTYTFSSTEKTMDIYLTQDKSYVFHFEGTQTGSNYAHIKIENPSGYYTTLYDATGARTVNTDATYSAASTGTYKLHFDTGAATTKVNLNLLYFRPTYMFAPNVFFDWLLGYSQFSAGKVRFYSDGSGQLADGNIQWDRFGNPSMSGLRFRRKTVITSDNYTEYGSTIEGRVGWRFDLKKTGTWIQISSFPTSTYSQFLFLGLSNSTSTEEEKDDARSLVGEKIVIYNKTGATITLTGYIIDSDSSASSGNSYSLNSGECAQLECKMRAFGASTSPNEDVYWLITKMTSR